MSTMRNALRIATLIAGAAGPAFAQEQKVPLPDVNVTAPANTESFITRGFTNPYAGHTRVEEDKWPVIPCATSRISSVAGGTCQTGMPTETFMSLSNGEAPNCIIYHQLVTFQTGTLSVEADSFIFDPFKVVSGSPTGHQDKNCVVWSGYLRLPDDFEDMNQVTRRGAKWQGFAKGNPSARWHSATVRAPVSRSRNWGRPGAAVTSGWCMPASASPTHVRFNPAISLRYSRRSDWIGMTRSAICGRRRAIRPIRRRNKLASAVNASAATQH